VAESTEGHVLPQQVSLLSTASSVQGAIFNSANFLCIATDRSGVIQVFNVGAEHLLGYSADDLVNKVFLVDICDKQNLVERAKTLSSEYKTPLATEFEVVTHKAAQGLEDVYELTFRRKDGDLFPSVLSVTGLRQNHGAAIGFLLIGTDLAARKLAEKTLLKTDALKHAIFNSANFSIVATDERGIIQLFNVGAEHLLGYSAADVVNKMSPADLSDPQELIERARALSEEFQTPIAPGFEALGYKASRGLEDIYELTYIRQDGTRFPAVVSVSALRQDHGPVIGYLLIGTDNTARQHAKEALLQVGALQDAILNSSNFAIIALDVKGIIQIFGVGAQRLLGYTANEVVNKLSPTDFIDSQELSDQAKALSTEFQTPIAPGIKALTFKTSRGIEDICELNLIRKDGSNLPAVLSIAKLTDATDTIVGYLLIGIDNSARKEDEATQEELNQRLRDLQFYTRSLIESSIDAIMTTTPSGFITDVNKQAEILTGCTRDELIGAPFKKFFTDRERAETAIKLVLKEKKLTNYELIARDRLGTETVVSLNATTFYDRDRRLQGVFAAARDITERKQAEARILAALHDPLTGLPNRSLLMDRLGYAMAASKRSGLFGALIFLDMDNFKPINDTHGHDLGDALLIEVAHRLTACVREMDAVSRFGGDEFVILVSELQKDKLKSSEQARLVAEKIRRTLARPYILKLKNATQPDTSIEHHCTASIGVTLFFNHETSQADALKDADAVMYLAKSEGGNVVRFHGE
jgi:diguanylate cyclase (GGDEF)-like protein/PAS domain S-box-containing protein